MEKVSVRQIKTLLEKGDVDLSALNIYWDTDKKKNRVPSRPGQICRETF